MTRLATIAIAALFTVAIIWAFGAIGAAFLAGAVVGVAIGALAWLCWFFQ